MPAYVLKSDKDTVFSFRIVISPDLSAEGFKKNEIIYESNTFSQYTMKHLMIK